MSVTTLKKKNGKKFQDLSTPLTACKICCSEEIVPLGTCEDYYMTNDVFLLYKCMQCGVVFTNYFSTDTKKYYPNNYYAHTAGQKFSLREIMQLKSLRLKQGYNMHAIESYITKLLNKFILVDLPYIKNGKILDIGCGAGKLLDVAKSVGFDCYGVEPSLNARKILNEKGYTTYENISEITAPENFFDVIVFNQSLEHIPEPFSALSGAKKYLKDSGLCIVSVPNFECNERSVFGMYWRHIDVPRHLYHFSSRSLEIAGARAGLSLVEKRYKFWGFLPDKASYKMFRERKGVIGYLYFLKYCLMQFFSVITLNKCNYGQMMSFYFKSS